MTKHGWFVLVQALEAPDRWECAFTEMFSTKREAMWMLREYRSAYPNERLSFFLAKAVVVPVGAEAKA